MAELEAITDVQADPKKSAVMARQYGRRFPLAPNKPLNLGRDEGKMDIAIPEDDQISRFQAVLTWEPGKEKLTVQTRPTSPGYPNPPANQTLIFDEKSKKLVEAPAGKCVVGRGESFWIGQTRFTLHSDDEAAPESPADMTVAPRQEEKTRAQLEDIPFANPAAALRAMESLPNAIKAIGNEQTLFRQMLRVVMDAMPRADAAAIVRIPPDCPPGEKRLSVPEFSVRPNTPHAQGGFNPSKRLAHRAILERRRSCLHCWSPESAAGAGAELTMADTHVHGVTPWAVCTPFQDGTRYALYVAGQTNGQWNLLDKAAQDKIVNDLTQYQKIGELLVGVIETTLRVSRLTEQNKVIRRAWPQSLWKYLDDPAELEKMLVPEEKSITTLFCDLRNYSLFASLNAGDLLGGQRQIGNALNTMASAITDRDGVVGGFRGDAVLGFWGWPKPQDGQVARAARAAIAIAGRLNDYTRTGRCGVAITHGIAVAGRLGAHDLAVVDLYGPVVNLTFRLEGMTKAFGVPIIVSDEIARQVREVDPYGREMRTRPLGKVRAKGFPEPVEAFELYSAQMPSVPEWLQEQWTDAVALFTEGRWADAASLLTDQFPDDTAGRCLMRFMDANSRRPPEKDGKKWDGSFVPPNPPGTE